MAVDVCGFGDEVVGDDGLIIGVVGVTHSSIVELELDAIIEDSIGISIIKVREIKK